LDVALKWFVMESASLHFYLIPGMGANAQLYDGYTLPGEIHVMHWPPAGESKTLADYARLLAQQIHTTNNVLVGSSMGGMLATELSHLVRPMATILLSAPCGRHQFPTRLRLLRHLHLHRILSAQGMFRLATAADLFMGFRHPSDRDRFYAMLHSNGPDFLHFCIGAVLEWQHTGTPTGPYMHVLGSDDRLFDYKKIQPSLVLPNAGHFATFEKREMICRIIAHFCAYHFDAASAIENWLPKAPQ
jgi:pimeloyl-ACP methyl ester carboxylesterase